MTSEVFNVDCMDFMRDQPDKAFALAIADPPYGIRDAEKTTCTAPIANDAARL